ncbi:MAG: hypothetical protein KJ573_00085 [Proteobacteria bacterium]|nr:hypothetical protein [Pseudomonadota bacterium]MBU1901971.1 hypothetical protein [Pseudomonadota bacterium]
MNRIPHCYCRLILWKRIVTEVRHPWRLRLWTQVLVTALLVSSAHAESKKQLWVLQEPDEIVEFDVSTFEARRRLKVPHPLLQHPEYLIINAKGQMVFFPPNGVTWGSGQMGSAAGRIWFWDGHTAMESKLEGAKIRGGCPGEPTVTETVLQRFLSAGGDSLFWFENRFEKVMGESGQERSLFSNLRVWRTDLDGDRLEIITGLSSPEWCRCQTGVCSETCPAWDFWAPDGVVDDFFLLTRVTPGQLQATYHESLLYQFLGRTWQVKKLPQPIEKPLTASEKGDVLVVAVPDGGCCGWDNDSSDQMLLLRNGKVSVLYDEYGRYGNRNYDVSFYPADARLAAGDEMLAYTIVSTARTGGEIRLSSEGKENAEELARVRKTVAELPAVEVVKLGIQPRPITIIRHAELVGWMNDHAILVAQKNGHLTVYDIRGSKRQETTIRVRNAADAFLRKNGY